MGIGVKARCKINANIGNSAVTSNIDNELAKLKLAVDLGSDTVMDLSTGGNIDAIRQAIIEASHGSHWHGAHVSGDPGREEGRGTVGPGSAGYGASTRPSRASIT